MSDITQILSAIEGGDLQAAEKLLPLVYDELRKLAVAKMKNEQPGHTLQAMALVHEAYVRLVEADQSQGWKGTSLLRRPKRCGGFLSNKPDAKTVESTAASGTEFRSTNLTPAWIQGKTIYSP